MADTRDVSSVLFGRRELVITTDAEDFRYLRANWSGVYTIVRPSQDDDTWKAIARFGNGDQLIADTADELLALIRRHYGPETEGYVEMLMGRLGRKYT
jgi:hypothetical protein